MLSAMPAADITAQTLRVAVNADNHRKAVFSLVEMGSPAGNNGMSKPCTGAWVSGKGGRRSHALRVGAPLPVVMSRGKAEKTPRGRLSVDCRQLLPATLCCYSLVFPKPGVTTT